jgi:hypothetical protein
MGVEKEKTMKELKSEYGTVWTLTVEREDGKEVSVHLRSLDRKIYKLVMTFMANDQLKGVEAFLRNLTVGGDDVNLIIEDFEALRSASYTILELIEPKEGVLKKN